MDRWWVDGKVDRVGFGDWTFLRLFWGEGGWGWNGGFDASFGGIEMYVRGFEET